MKKLFFIPFFLTISYFSNAQFKVYDNGNVGIGISNTVAGNKVKINGSWGRALVLNVAHTQDWIASMETVVNRPNSASYVVVYSGSPTFYVRGDGLVCSATGFYDWSDESYKTNIVSIDNPLEKLMSLNGYYYDFSPEIQSLQHLDRQIGLIAQEVEAVIPEVVAIGMDDKRAVDYSKLVLF